MTMDLVEELSYGVVQEYRERQKNILKRTFVSGSDAAESRVNRRGKSGSFINDVTHMAPTPLPPPPLSHRNGCFTYSFIHSVAHVLQSVYPFISPMYILCSLGTTVPHLSADALSNIRVV